MNVCVNQVAFQAVEKGSTHSAINAGFRNVHHLNAFKCI